MATRDLFDKKKPYKILRSSDMQELSEKVESGENVEAALERKKRFIPRLDYSDPSNFVRFGSAEKYYEDAFDRITNFYPYDGSEKEVNQYFNSSSFFDLYIFENEYPRTTGYAILHDNSYTPSAGVSGWKIVPSAEKEYIRVLGGPHTASSGMPSGTLGLSFTGSNKYDTDIYDTARMFQGTKKGTQQSNLRFDLQDGVCVEFWLKKTAWQTSNKDTINKTAVFDLWNGYGTSSAESGEYGRFLVSLSASGDDGAGSGGNYPIGVHIASGSTVWDLQVGASITTASLGNDWNHYALSIVSSSVDSSIISRFYLNGAFQEQSSSGDIGSFNEVTGSLIAHLGALQTTPSGNAFTGLDYKGNGGLDASLDEFRYWKASRSGEDIGLNFFTNVRGGTNTDPSNADLGVYYKFNEGITTTSSIDSIVLDYSGRISNGTWVGYPGSTARNTGSAIVSASAAPLELEDPIVRSSHPDVVLSRTQLIESGSVYDNTSNSSIFEMMPSWIIDDDNGNLKKVTQIIANYFDSLHLQMEELPRLKEITYASSSNSEIPFANRLVMNYGMDAPEIFADADILSQIMNRDEKRNFDLELSDIKNRIYKNIYNNLVYIYKTKGTDKSFRNLIRCYGVGDELIKINLYANNYTYDLRSNYETTVSRKKYVNFNDPDSFAGVVTQQSSSTNINASNVTFVSGTIDAYIPTTAEIEVIFPKKVTDRGSLAYFDTPFVTASIFGNHVLKTAGDPNCYVQAAVADDAAWSLYAVRDEEESPHAYFVFKSNRGSTVDFTLTSSLYTNLYDNEKWNFAVRTVNVKNPVADGTSGSFAGSDTDFDIDDTYIKLELYGVNYDAGILKNELLLTSSAIARPQYLTSDRRYYVGADRTNWTGSVNHRTDIRASSLRHWMSHIGNETVQAHARDPENYGALRPNRSSYLLQTSMTGARVPELETLALHWNYESVSKSDSNGEFEVDDFSSGSIDKISRYSDHIAGNKLSKTIAYQYPGRGYSFDTSTTGVIDRAYVDAEKLQAPESLNSSDMISILSLQDETMFTRESRPINYFYAFEKSMYRTISEEMINFFGSIVEFHNLIGDPKNRYRQDYKDMEKLRELFFERIRNTPDLDKYIEYYKWIDNSLSVMLQQLVPASADFSDGIRTMVESHVLERNKYRSKFPTLEMKVTDPEAAVRGITELKYDWEHGHAPLGLDDEAKNCMWWRERAERTIPLISSSVASVNTDREAQREIIETYRTGSPGPTLANSTRTLPTNTYQGSTYALRRFDEIYNFIVDESPLYHGGPDYSQRKRYGFITPQIRTFGDSSITNTHAIIEAGSLEFGKDCDDAIIPPELDKKKVSYKFAVTSNSINLGGPYEDMGVGDIYSPFSVYSSSVQTGYQDTILRSGTSRKLTTVGSIGISGMHHDIIGNDMEVPMQGPFTEKYVGGNQWRHQDLVHDPATTGSSNGEKRAEGFKLTITSDGDLLLASRRGTSPSALYTRDEAAKRPVNIRNIQMTASDIGAYKTTLPAGTGTPIGPTPTEFISGTLRSNIGNFENFYDIVQTSGRSINNAALTEQDGFSKATVSPATTGHTQQVVGTLKPQRGKHEHVFVQRFSAPGGPDTAGDANGGFGLDFESAEFSPYNALPFRNTSVRTPLNRTLLTRHARQFGIFNDAADADLALDPLTAPRLTGSYHKTNRNTLNRIVFGGTADYSISEAHATPETGSFRDNAFINHEIPRMETSYAWITSSFVHSFVNGHGHPEGTYSNSSGIHSSIDFVSSSDVVSYLDTFIGYGGDPKNGSPFNNVIAHQTTHLNTNIVEPLSASEATLGYKTTTPVGFYINYGNIDRMPNTTVIHAGSFIQFVSNIPFNTASVLHDLNIYRNGYYGYPSWKQTRTAENKLVRHYRKNNQITINQEVGSQISPSVGPPIRERFGSFQSFFEPPVDTSNKPIVFDLLVRTFQGTAPASGLPVFTPERCIIETTFANDLTRFANRDLEELVQVGTETLYTSYNTAKDMYLNLAADDSFSDDTQPIAGFNSVTYTQRVFPAAYNVGLGKVRKRDNYTINFWADSRAERTTLGLTKSSSMGFAITQSAWAMDASQIYETGPICTASNASSSAAGELQNDYSMVHGGVHSHATNKQFVTASALYARKHMLPCTASTISFLLENPQTGGVGAFAVPIGAGTSLWEASELAGRIKVNVDDNGNITKTFESDIRYPADSNYDRYMEEAILKNQHHSIIPEFRISEHIERYFEAGDGDLLADNNRLLSIFGANGTQPKNSSEDLFYKTFSNSDFLKQFDIVYNDHKPTYVPKQITLKCRAIKKFLAYDGFYPAQRTIDLATRLSKSYGRFVNNEGGVDFSSNDGVTYPNAALRPFLAPLFAPGIMFNTIKSGIAVDYGVYTGSFSVQGNTASVGNSSGDSNIFFVGNPTAVDGGGRGTGADAETASGFDYRVPFEAIVSPGDYLKGMTFVDMEPHPSASFNMTSSWSGEGDPLYEMMVNNFLAESVNTFLPNGQMSTLISSKESEFKTFVRGKVYGMRIKIRRSLNKPRTYRGPDGKSNYPYPTVTNAEVDTDGIRESFTMYSRPSAFGPPMLGRTIVAKDQAVGAGDPLYGYNPAYTPPYYDGEAWCDIIFRATHSTHTLQEILANSEVISLRIDPEVWSSAGGNAATRKPVPYDKLNVNKYAMQLTSSISIDGIAKVNEVSFRPDGTPELVTSSPTTAENVWVIQPRFETPMFNFTNTSGALRPITEADGTLTVPANGNESVSRGIWHQFGLPPEAADQGVFLEISEIPTNWITNRLATTDADFKAQYKYSQIVSGGGLGNLADQVGFYSDNASIRLGEVAESYKVSEAIVAIPFTEVDGVRSYFEIPPESLLTYRLDPRMAGAAAGSPLADLGPSIKNQFDTMQKYVIPPQFNCLDFEDVDPIAMYFFEFEHTFTKDDLTYMWQNLPPKASKDIETAETSVSHPLLVNELMGYRGSETSRAYQEEVQWMVFKVKQKAKYNYYEKVLSRVGSDESFVFDFTLAGKKLSITDAKYSYNWPYDFFSLVEFANLEASVSIGDPDPENELSADYIPESTTRIALRELAGSIEEDIEEVSSGFDEPL